MSFFTHLYKTEAVAQPEKHTKYELIDADPIFSKVVGYFRPSDYAIWGLGIAFAPAAFRVFEFLDPNNGRRFVKPSGTNNRFLLLIGLSGGFLAAYTRSGRRLMGCSENKAEVKKDRYETKKYLSEYGVPYPKSELDPWLQYIAFKNSKNSIFGLGNIPWFNFVNHTFHGVDIAKYYEVRPGEEDWGFTLPALEQVANTSVSEVENY